VDVAPAEAADKHRGDHPLSLRFRGLLQNVK